MTDFFTTLSHAALQDNLVLIQLLGVSAFVAGSGRLRPALELAQLMFLLMLCASLLNLSLNALALVPMGLEFLQLPCFAISGAALTVALHQLLTRYNPLLARRHGSAVLFFGGSSAVVGTSLLATAASSGFASAMAISLGSATGYCLLLILVAALRERLDGAAIPDAFKGAPATLICLGIVSLALFTLH